MLAFAWCHRLQFFFDVWRAQEDPLYVYSDADIMSYVEEMSFRDFVRKLAPSSEAAKKAALISSLRPNSPLVVDLKKK